MNNKNIAIVLILIMAISSMIIAVKPAFAQSIPTPAIPEFSLKFVDASYDVPTTQTIDPYTGQNVTHEGYHVNNTILVMAVQNQPLVYQYNGSFYYNIRIKGHYEEWNEWSEWFKPDELPRANSTSSQTLITLGVLTTTGLAINSGSREMDIPSDGTVDFQVEAMIGSIGKNLTEGPAGSLYFAGQTSGWSNTLTLNLSDGSVSISTSPNSTLGPTPTPTVSSSLNPTPTPTVPELSSWTLPLLLSIMAATAGLLVYFIKRKNINSKRRELNG